MKSAAIRVGETKRRNARIREEKRPKITWVVTFPPAFSDWRVMFDLAPGAFHLHPEGLSPPADAPDLQRQAIAPRLHRAIVAIKRLLGL
jgi:hypothetical protein